MRGALRSDPPLSRSSGLGRAVGSRLQLDRSDSSSSSSSSRAPQLLLSMRLALLVTSTTAAAAAAAATTTTGRGRVASGEGLQVGRRWRRLSRSGQWMRSPQPSALERLLLLAPQGSSRHLLPGAAWAPQPARDAREATASSTSTRSEDEAEGVGDELAFRVE